MTLQTLLFFGVFCETLCINNLFGLSLRKSLTGTKSVNEDEKSKIKKRNFNMRKGCVFMCTKKSIMKSTELFVPVAALVNDRLV